MEKLEKSGFDVNDPAYKRVELVGFPANLSNDDRIAEIDNFLKEFDSARENRRMCWGIKQF